METKGDFKLDLAFIRQGNKKEPLKEAQNVAKLESLLETSSEVFSYKEKVYGHDILMYIYTSGTTGLPKVICRGFNSNNNKKKEKKKKNMKL